ncbi:hypothetical protein [Nitrospira sp. BLG_2]
MLNLLNQQSASSDEIVAVSERRTVLEAKESLMIVEQNWISSTYCSLL